MDVDDQGRPLPPSDAGELETLVGFLDFHRATLAWRTGGLDDTQLATVLPPSAMTLGGLLTHLAYVEDHWFHDVVAEQPRREPWSGVDWAVDRDWDWDHAARLGGDGARALWTASVERSREVVAQQLADATTTAEALDRTHVAWGGRGRASLRWVLVHMVEEYSRHNGHADLLRESIDGQVGE